MSPTSEEKRELPRRVSREIAVGETIEPVEELSRESFVDHDALPGLDFDKADRIVDSPACPARHAGRGWLIRRMSHLGAGDEQPATPIPS